MYLFTQLTISECLYNNQQSIIYITDVCRLIVVFCLSVLFVLLFVYLTSLVYLVQQIQLNYYSIVINVL